MREQLENWLVLPDDLTGFYGQVVGDHPAFVAKVKSLYGFHHVRFFTLA